MTEAIYSESITSGSNSTFAGFIQVVFAYIKEIEVGAATMKKPLFLLIIIGLLSSILFAQAQYLSIVDINGQRVNVSIDTIKNMTFAMDQTYGLRINQTDGSQSKAVITTVKKMIFAAGSELDSRDRQTATVPNSYVLYQNYPNPFNPITIINYQLPITSEVALSIFTLLGQKVATLISEKQPAGRHQVKWNAGGFSSGIYIYRLEANRVAVQTKKLIVLK
jgi:hypothetical protein